MGYTQLRAFHYVAVEGGFSKAAAALQLSQPAISDQVRKLEDAHEIILINRQRRRIELTPAGRKLFEITKRLFAAEDQAADFLSESQTLRTGSLRVVADSAHHVLHILAEFRSKFPDVSISMSAGNTEQIIAKLHDFQADVGVLGDVPESRDFETVRLSSEVIVAFASRTHKVSRSPSLTFAELAAQPLVLREAGSKTREKLEAEAARRGLTLRVAIEAEGREAVREIVATGIGIGVVSAAEFGQDRRLVAIPISDCVMRMDEALVCLRERGKSRLIRAFFRCAQEIEPATGN